MRCFGAVALTLAGCGHFQATAPVALGGDSANPGLYTWERYRLLTSPPDRERKLGELLDSWNAGNDWHKEHVLGTLCDAELADSAVLNVLAQHVRKNPQLILELAGIRDVVECRDLSQSAQPLDETSRELMNDSELRSGRPKRTENATRISIVTSTPRFILVVNASKRIRPGQWNSCTNRGSCFLNGRHLYKLLPL